MTLKTQKSDRKAQFCECALTDISFDGRFSPLRIWQNEAGSLSFDLSNRTKNGAIFIDPDKHLLNQLLKGQRHLPDGFPTIFPDDFIAQICALYEKKTFEALGFMLKASQAVIGRRAIDRALLGATEHIPLAILQTPEGSDAICKNFLHKQKNIKIIPNFPTDILQKISGREKISYYCILDTDMGRVFVRDYHKYLQIKGE